jgi:hypothetical protein
MTVQLPQWATQNQNSFKHAPTWLRRLAKDRHISPTHYAMKAGSGDYIQCYFWNSRHIEHYDGRLPMK